MLRKNFPNRKAQRRDQANVRQAEYDALSNEERLARLIARGHGSCGEAWALRKRLS